MISRVLKAVFGSRNDRLLKHYGRSVRAINSLEPSMAALPDHGLGAKTLELRERFAKRVQGVPEEERDAAERRRSPSSCRSPSPWFARRRSACSTCAISTCS